MKFLLGQIAILVISVAFLLYLFSVEYFTPVNIQGGLNWYGIFTVLFLLFVLSQSIISLTIFLAQKLLAYGWKEFPDPWASLKWGIGLSLAFVAALLLNSFHILTLQWGLLAILLVILAIVVI
jgi:hypothetical protein